MLVCSLTVLFFFCHQVWIKWIYLENFAMLNFSSATALPAFFRPTLLIALIFISFYNLFISFYLFISWCKGADFSSFFFGTFLRHLRWHSCQLYIVAEVLAVRSTIELNKIYSAYHRWFCDLRKCARFKLSFARRSWIQKSSFQLSHVSVVGEK